MTARLIREAVIGLSLSFVFLAALALAMGGVS